jgi:hypothetical protein
MSAGVMMTDLHPIAALDHVIKSYRVFLQTEFSAKDENASGGSVRPVSRSALGGMNHG